MGAGVPGPCGASAAGPVEEESLHPSDTVTAQHLLEVENIALGKGNATALATQMWGKTLCIKLPG